jgi:hypothetical protein
MTAGLPRRRATATSAPMSAAARTLEASRRETVVVKREKVIDAEGRRWVTGLLDSDTYFAEVRRQAREQARVSVAARLARRLNPPRHSLAGR